MKISRKAHPMRVKKGSAAEGWWYEAGKSIEVYLRDKSLRFTLSGRIDRATLLDWIERTK